MSSSSTPEVGLFRHLRQVGIQGIRAFAYLKLALQPLALEKIHSSLQWRAKEALFHNFTDPVVVSPTEVPKPAFLYSDVELYEGRRPGSAATGGEREETIGFNPCPGHARS
ncbi:hypothetical protein Salat_2782100 [Sesamum alatum]|uniref:Uncharacterized protein n=1 Tax=Sesamum alatum TaxID=300844 RepID=A0AAE1XKU6_9LAMI|nr:hypothetical protein Salat_2782100 [Sesamum alatum]